MKTEGGQAKYGGFDEYEGKLRPVTVTVTRLKAQIIEAQKERERPTSGPAILKVIIIWLIRTSRWE